MTAFAHPALALVAALSLGGCAQLGIFQPEDGPSGANPSGTSPSGVAPSADVPQASAAEIAAARPDPVLTSAPPPPRSANTQAALDTTTAEQRQQASRPAAARGVERSLGSTVASLGSPTKPGFWLETPLVTTEAKGRITNKANGKSSAVTLIPIEGPATGGSRLSLPAMRLIDASLTDLAQLDVTIDPS